MCIVVFVSRLFEFFTIVFVVTSCSKCLSQLLRSYVIQHFDDHLRQCVIDLQLGELRDGSQLLHQDQPLDTVLAVCRTLVEPLVAAVPARPNRQVYSLSVFRNELWLTEQLVHFTRFAAHRPPYLWLARSESTRASPESDPTNS